MRIVSYLTSRHGISDKMQKTIHHEANIVLIY